MIHPEGIIRKASGGYVYYYAKKDHLGSTRVLAYEAGGKMKAAQTMDYYPFGLSFRNYGMNYNRYLFSGKELQDQDVNGKALQLYDFGARNYDPMLGRWFNIDPALQLVNPYIYCGNNPIMFTDPDGKWFFTFIFGPLFLPLDIALWSATINYGVQVGMNYAAGKTGRNAWLNNVDFLDVGISFLAGGLGAKFVPAALWIGYGGEVLSNGIDWYGDGRFGVVGAGIEVGDFLVRNVMSASSIYLNQYLLRGAFAMPAKNDVFPVFKPNKHFVDGVFDFTQTVTTNVTTNALERPGGLNNYGGGNSSGGLLPLGPHLNEVTKSTNNNYYKKKKNEKYIFEN